MRTGPALPVRDTHLAIAAFILAVGRTIYAAQDMIGMSLTNFFADPWVGAGWIVSLGGLLSGIAGFLVVGLALLGASGARARRVRLGALLVAGSYSLGFAGMVVYNCPDFIAGITQTEHGWQVAGLLAELFGMVAATWVACAFAAESPTMPSRGAIVRNRRLGWACVWYGAAACSALVADVLLDWTSWAKGSTGHGPLGTYLGARLVGNILILVAFAIAAAGFFGAARLDASSDRNRLWRRAAFLTAAAGVLAVAAVFTVCGRITAVWDWAFYWKSLDTPGKASYWWLWGLASLPTAIAGFYAARAFALSRRSVLGRD